MDTPAKILEKYSKGLIGADEVISSAYVYGGDPRLISQKVPVNEQVKIAIDILRSKIKQPKGFSIPKGAGGQQQAQSTSTQTPTTTSPSSSPSPASSETQKLAETGDTKRLAQTGNTTKLAVSDETKKLAINDYTTQTLPETDIQAAEGQTKQLGTPEAPATGDTTRLTPGDIYTVPFTPSVGRKTQKLPSTRRLGRRSTKPMTQYRRYQTQLLAKLQGPKIDPYRDQIQRIATGTTKRIQEGYLGDAEWRQALQADPDAVQSLVFRNITARHMLDYVIQEREDAEQYKDNPLVSKALQTRTAMEESLRRQGLLDNTMTENQSFKSFYEGNVNNGTWDQVTPLDPMSSDEYVQRATATQVELLHNFQALQPKLAQDLGITDRIRDLPRPSLPTPQLPPIERVLPEIKEKLAQKFAGTAAGKAVTEATKKVATAGAEKAAGVAASAAAGTAVSGALTAALSFLGPLAPLAAKALTWLGGKLLLPFVKFIKRNAPSLAGAGLALMGGGVLLGSALFGALGAGLFALSFAGGGPAALVAGAAGIAGIIGAFFLTVFFSAIVLPILIAFGITVILIALILFIINTGGYVTPYAEPLASQSPTISLYIEVQKTANPAGPFANDALENEGLTVTYNITVNATKEDLTDIEFTNSYSIYQSPTKAVPPQVTIPNPPSTISQGETHTITYTVTYNEDFRDAVVCDNFRVSANVGGTQDAATSTACITIGNPPSTLGCEGGGNDITASLASRIDNGVVRLLPQDLTPRDPRTRNCIRPTMIVMHWAGNSNDNPSGNNQTYATLVERDLACQVATDTNDVWLMQPFYENKIEMAWCANAWNIYSINNEMAGVSFDASPPPPNLDELELAYKATCELMDQYNIPWTQIRGHYQINPEKADPGSAFLQNVFIPEIRRRCPNE